MKLRVVGSVTDGLGQGADFLRLEGYATQFETKLGYEPFPGTLNLSVDRTERPELHQAAAPTLLEAWSDGDQTFGAVDCYPATLHKPSDPETVDGHVIWPHRTDHDTTTLEVVAPVGLRERFALTDGDRLVMEVDD